MDKRRPTLEELKGLPRQLWRLEVAQLCEDAAGAGQDEILEDAELLMLEPDLTPEMIVELREKLQGATGSTDIEDAA
jgi:hypothetical protein